MEQKINEIIFSDEEIESIKTIVQNAEIISSEELENLIEIKNNLHSNDSNIGILFIKCYNLLEINYSKIKKEDNKLSKKIENYLKSFKISGLRELVEDYGNGKGYGSYLTKEKIKIIINYKREDYIDLIKFFFNIFGEEE